MYKKACPPTHDTGSLNNNLSLTHSDNAKSALEIVSSPSTLTQRSATQILLWTSQLKPKNIIAKDAHGVSVSAHNAPMLTHVPFSERQLSSTSDVTLQNSISPDLHHLVLPSSKKQNYAKQVERTEKLKRDTDISLSIQNGTHCDRLIRVQTSTKSTEDLLSCISLTIENSVQHKNLHGDNFHKTTTVSPRNLATAKYTTLTASDGDVTPRIPEGDKNFNKNDNDSQEPSSRRNRGLHRNIGRCHNNKKQRLAGLQIPQAPVFRPSVEEFENPLTYIASIRQDAEKFGICKIIPPPLWTPKCKLDPHNFKFNTRVQRLHRLFKRHGENTLFLESLQEYLMSENITLNAPPVFGTIELDFYQLSLAVARYGGLQEIINRNAWGKIADELRLPRKYSNRESKLQAFYYKYLLSFDLLSPDEKSAIAARVEVKKRDMETIDDSNTFASSRMHKHSQYETACRTSKNNNTNRSQMRFATFEGDPNQSPERFGYEHGRQFSLAEYKIHADEFKQAWFRCNQDVTSSDIEAEYWRLLCSAKEYVSVNYGNDVETTTHGSGFATNVQDPYARFGWNLNVLPVLPQSILRDMPGISGISTPWLYIGMLFATFCWHNEDNYLYSTSYMHFGTGKQWYGVSGADADKFETIFKKFIPEANLHDLITMLSPATLIQEGCPVVSLLQQEGEFVVTFPQAYHAGYSTGYNCCEAVNFAPADWLPFGSKAAAMYVKRKREPSLDFEKLLCNVAMRIVKQKAYIDQDKEIVGYLLLELKKILCAQAEIRQRLHFCGVKYACNMHNLSKEFQGCFKQAIIKSQHGDGFEVRFGTRLLMFQDEFVCDSCKCFCHVSALIHVQFLLLLYFPPWVHLSIKIYIYMRVYSILPVYHDNLQYNRVTDHHCPLCRLDVSSH